MTAQHPAALEIDVPYPDGEQTARFELGPLGDEQPGVIEDKIRTDFLVESSLSQIIAAISEVTGSGESRKGFNFDLGGGQHAVEIQWNSPGQTAKPNGDLYQWGTSPDPSVGPNEKTATGGTPAEQQAVFIHALRLAAPDSLTPARLEVGEYRPGGILPDDHLDVYVENPSVTYATDKPATHDGSVTLIETWALDEAIDSAEQEGF